MFSLKEPVHDKAVRVFHLNIFNENFQVYSFYSSVYKIPIVINPNFIATLGIPRILDANHFPPLQMFKEDKEAMTRRLCGKTIKWTTKLDKNHCKPVVQFLFRVFTYILLPMTHRSGLTFNMAYLIDSILEGKHIDLHSIICFVFLRADAANHPTCTLPFCVLISQILERTEGAPTVQRSCSSDSSYWAEHTPEDAHSRHYWGSAYWHCLSCSSSPLCLCLYKEENDRPSTEYLDQSEEEPKEPEGYLQELEGNCNLFVSRHS